MQEVCKQGIEKTDRGDCKMKEHIHVEKDVYEPLLNASMKYVAEIETLSAECHRLEQDNACLTADLVNLERHLKELEGRG